VCLSGAARLSSTRSGAPVSTTIASAFSGTSAAASQPGTNATNAAAAHTLRTVAVSANSKMQRRQRIYFARSATVAMRLANLVNDQP